MAAPVPKYKSLFKLSSFFSNEDVPLTLLKIITPIATEMLYSRQGAGFPDLMHMIAPLACSGPAHIHLLNAALEWLHIM